MIVVIACLMRSVLALVAFLFTKDLSIFYSPDTKSYLQLAQNLILNGRFGIEGLPEIVRTPGYPIFLIPGIWVGHVEWVTLTLQILLSGVSVYLVYKITFLIFENEKISKSSASFYAIEPLSVLYAIKLLPETFFTTAILVFLYFIISFLKTNRPLFILISAIALSLSVYIKPISCFLSWTMILILGVYFLMKKQFSRLKYLFLFGVICIGFMGVWEFRNYKLADYSKFSAIQDVNLYFYQGASVTARVSNTSFYKMQNEMGYHDEEIFLKRNPEYVRLNKAQRYKKMGEEGIKILLQHPMIYMAIHIKGMLRTLLDPVAVEYLKLFKQYPVSGELLGEVVDRGILKTFFHLLRKSPLAFWSHVFLGGILCFYLVLSLLGFLKARCDSYGVYFSILMMMSLYFWILSGGPQSLGRFRHSIMPIVCMMAGLGWEKLKKKNFTA